MVWLNRMFLTNSEPQIMQYIYKAEDGGAETFDNSEGQLKESGHGKHTLGTLLLIYEADMEFEVLYRWSWQFSNISAC